MADLLVRCTVERGVATVTLDSPSNRNALSQQLVSDLNSALDRAERDDVRVIVLTHTGPAFCAGADLKERMATAGPTDSSGMVRAIRRLEVSSQPTIAAVKGAVRAGGIGVMAACDLIVIDPAVDFAFTEVRLGLAPAIISVPVLRRVPWSRLSAAFLTGERFDAATAREVGLVTHVSEDVDAQVARLVGGILCGAPGAVAVTKQLMRSVATHDRDEAYDMMQSLSEALFDSPEGREGMRAFGEKRPPSWQLGPTDENG